MAEFEHPEQERIVQPSATVEGVGVDFVENPFERMLDANGEIEPAAESALKLTSGAGILALDNTVESDFSTDDQQKVSWADKIKDSLSRKKAALMTSALVTGAVGSWLFEIGPANENLRADVAVELLNQDKGALAAALAVSGITFAVESTAGLLSAKSIDKKDGLLGRFNKFLFKHAEEQNLEMETEDGHKKSDTLLGLAGGSTLVVIERLRRNPERTYKDSRKTALAAAAGIAAFSGAITGVAGDLIDWSVENEYYMQGNAIKETLEDWRTWMGLFALSQISPQINKLAAKFSKRSAESEGDVVIAEPAEAATPVLDMDVPERNKRHEAVKMGAKVAAGLGFIALGGPQEVAELINNQQITHDVGGWLADNKAIDKAEDFGSVLWDWRIYTAGFGALVAGNRIVRAVQDRKSPQSL